MIGPWQDRLIFRCVRPNLLSYSAHSSSEFRFKSGDVELQGWRVQGTKKSGVTLIYFGGNAEDITQNFADVTRWGVSAAYFLNYRGYGFSKGCPSQRALYADALAAYDLVASENGAATNGLVVIGRSLGAAVATYLAAQRPVTRVILATPFDSLSSLVRFHYPYFPVQWLLRHPFPSMDYARQTPQPLQMILASHDEVIPRENSLRLFDAWQGPKEITTIANSGHNTLHCSSVFHQTICHHIEAGR